MVVSVIMLSVVLLNVVATVEHCATQHCLQILGYSRPDNDKHTSLFHYGVKCNYIMFMAKAQGIFDDVFFPDSHFIIFLGVP